MDLSELSRHHVGRSCKWSLKLNATCHGVVANEAWSRMRRGFLVPKLEDSCKNGKKTYAMSVNLSYKPVWALVRSHPGGGKNEKDIHRWGAEDAEKNNSYLPGDTGKYKTSALSFSAIRNAFPNAHPTINNLFNLIHVICGLVIHFLIRVIRAKRFVFFFI